MWEHSGCANCKKNCRTNSGCHSKQLLNQYTRCLLNIYFTVNGRLRLENAYDKQSRKLKKLFLHRT